MIVIPPYYYHVCTQMLEAVEFLHLKINGIIHRGIKPENILFKDDDTHFILAGFSLATFGPPPLDARRHVDTFEYIPPEVYEGLRETSKVDIWAIGVLGLDMLRLLPLVEEKNRNFPMMGFLDWCELVFELGQRADREELKLMLGKKPSERNPAGIILRQLRKGPDFRTTRFRPSRQLIFAMFREDFHFGGFSDEELWISAGTYLDSFRGNQMPPTTELLRRQGGRRPQRSTRQTDDAGIVLDFDSEELLRTTVAGLQQLSSSAVNRSPLPPALSLEGHDERRSRSSSSTTIQPTAQQPRPSLRRSAATAGSSAQPPPGAVSLNELLKMSAEQVNDILKDIPRRDLQDLKLEDMPQATGERGQRATGVAAQRSQAPAARPTAPQETQGEPRKSRRVSLKTVRMDDFLQLTPLQKVQISNIPQLNTGSQQTTTAAASGSHETTRIIPIREALQMEEKELRDLMAGAQTSALVYKRRTTESRDRTQGGRQEAAQPRQQSQLVPPPQQQMTPGPDSSSGPGRGEGGGSTRGGNRGGNRGGRSARGKKRR
jgi:serine/threonine protein kinase